MCSVNFKHGVSENLWVSSISSSNLQKRLAEYRFFWSVWLKRLSVKAIHGAFLKSPFSTLLADLQFIILSQTSPPVFRHCNIIWRAALSRRVRSNFFKLNIHHVYLTYSSISVTDNKVMHLWMYDVCLRPIQRKTVSVSVANFVFKDSGTNPFTNASNCVRCYSFSAVFLFLFLR